MLILYVRIGSLLLCRQMAALRRRREQTISRCPRDSPCASTRSGVLYLIADNIGSFDSRCTFLWFIEAWLMVICAMNFSMAVSAQYYQITFIKKIFVCCKLLIYCIDIAIVYIVYKMPI